MNEYDDGRKWPLLNFIQNQNLTKEGIGEIL